VAVVTPAAAETTPGGRIAFWALMAFTGILILSPQVWFPFLKSLRPALLAAAVAIVAHLLDRAVRGRSSGRTRPEFIIAFCLVGWAAFTVPLSIWPGGSLATLTEHYLKAVAFFWLIGTLVTTGPRLRLLLWLLVLSAIPLSITAVLNYQSGVFLQTPTGAPERIAGYNIGGSGLTSNPNDLALMINLLIPFAAGLMVVSSSLLQRLVAGGALLISMAGVIVTFSRAGFLTLATMTIVGLLATVARRPLVAVAAVFVLAVGLAMVPQGYLQRLGTITNISSDTTGSAQGRWTDLQAAFDVVVRNPLVGVGLNQNVLALNEERGATWREVHNVYLQYAVDLGIPGLALFSCLFIALFRTAGRVRRAAVRDPALREVGVVAGTVQLAFVAFAVAAFFHPVAYQFYFFCIAGLALAVENVYQATTQGGT
jgi:probable O-glycosylation ligase (exosortase A-associated)